MEAMELYRQWLADFADDADTVADLKAIENDPKEIEDRFYKELEFGTAGMRGVLGAGTNRLNIYNVRRVTRALAKYILTTPDGAEKGVAIAYDSRHMSDVFAKQAALVLCNAGVKAYLFDSLRPVPVLSFTIRHLKCIAGIVITASHNPKQYNGYKAYWTDGGQMPPESVKGITDRLPETTYAESVPMDEAEALAKGLLTYIGKDVDDAYIAAVKKLSVNPELAREMGKTLKIVYTPLHGSGNIPVRRIFREIGMENVYVVPEQELPDGDFPTVKVPNPEDPGAFALALKMQEKLGADLCVGTDPDCDRVGIACMTESGPRLLNGNQIGCILLHYILSQKKERGELPANAAAVTTIVSTDMAAAIAKSFGCEMIEVLTGFKYIAEQIHRFETTGCNTFMFGFEESFGYLSGTDVRDKDGVNACMLIAEAAAWYKKMYNKTLVDAIDMLYEQYGYYGDKVTSFVLPGKDGLEKMQAVMQALRANPPKSFAGTDVKALRDYQTSKRICGETVEKLTLPKSNVLYFELEGGAWICVRPSGTEPKIKLYVNAVSGSAGETQRLLNAYSDAAVKLLESL
ncbi:MAG TPA: phospho-sugar mutase [Candidatus Faecivicinus avistercoris]|nr:phospho-sugar mutase [Candidatus Faecivicinus avistercoris]